MELVIALSIIFSVMALCTAIYTGEELMKLQDSMKLQDRTKRILDLAQRVIDDNDRMIKYIDALEDRTKRDD